MAWLLYSRRGCHLCEVAEDIVLARRADVRVVDVDADPILRAEFDLRVPVLVVDGIVVAEGRFTEADVAALVAARPSDA